MLTSLAMVLLCGLLLGSLFKKVKLPGLIGMLLTGILLGPHVFQLLDDKILLIGPDLRELALIIILTRAGLSLDLKDLKAIGRPAVFLSFVPACFEMTATIVFAPLLLGITYLEAALLGAVIASASPAVIVPRMLKLMEEGYGTNKRIPQMVLAGDSIDDVFNIVVFTALLGFHKGEGVNFLQAFTVPSSIALGALLGLVTGIILSYFFKKVTVRPSVAVIMLLGLGFSFVGIEKALEGMIPISGLLAVMVNGIIVLKKIPKVAEQSSKQFSELWVGAEIILFVMVGATVNISFALDYIWQALLLLVIILAIRGIGILLCLVKTEFKWKERFFVTLTGIPKATVQAAIGGIPLAVGLPCGPIVLSVAVISILVTAPFGAIILDFSYKKLLSKQNVVE